MNEHALELLHLALWMLGVVGSAMVAIGVWGTAKVLELLDDQQKSMDALRSMAHAMDMRLTRVEERCSIVTNNNSGYHRRATDTQPQVIKGSTLLRWYRQIRGLGG